MIKTFDNCVILRQIYGLWNTYFLMRNLNFWSKIFILNFLSSQCPRLLRSCTKWRGWKKIKSTSFHQYSWNSEVETTWISLIGWHHKTSILYPMNICFVASEFILLQKNSWTLFTKEFFPINVFQWYTTMFWLVMFNIDIFSRKCFITLRTLNWLNIINQTISITFADMPLKISFMSVLFLA